MGVHLSRAAASARLGLIACVSCVAAIAACSSSSDVAPQSAGDASAIDASSDANASDATSADAGDSGSFTTAPHPAFPQLLAGTGRVLRPMRVVTVVAQNDTLAADLFAFSDALVSSQWW